MHRRLPAHLQAPVRCEQIEISGGWQSEWRELYFDSVRFYREELPPWKGAARPKRNLVLMDGQSPGANVGPGRLPFPVREETILPMHWGGRFRNRVTADDGSFLFQYLGKDCELRYRFDPKMGLSGISAELGGAAVGHLLDGAEVRLAEGATNRSLKSVRREGQRVMAEYDEGTTLQVQIWQKSLVVDVINRTQRATELGLGRMTEVQDPRVISIPYLTLGGGPQPGVLLSRAGTNPVFTSLWLDWYRSNGAELYAAESATNQTARINGGVRYLPRTDGQRNPMFERLFVTVSPTLEEVLPVIANPRGQHAPEAVDRLWQESWGPDDFVQQQKRSEKLRAYGIEKLIQCNHEIAWRDGGESFTLRLRAAPKKGGDDALREYVAHQRRLGWMSGLYSNYTDYAPVNEFWSPDGVQRTSDGNWRSAWPRC